MIGNRIERDNIRVGEPLPWNVFDARGMLLLRRGFIIDSQYSLDRLVETGLYLRDERRLSARVVAPEPEEERPSALQHVIDARRLFRRLMQNFSTRENLSSKVFRIAELVDLACQANPDVAIGSILLLQSDSYTLRHHVNTAIISNLLARATAMPEEDVRSITAAALTMNVAMYKVQDKLNDVPGRLNDRLRALINAHPLQGAERLAKFGVTDSLWLRCVEQHHEHQDGSGYPRGLAGDAIELGAKIIGLADKYCARVSIRKYRSPQPPSIVARDLYLAKGTKIDPSLAIHLIPVLGIYPPGTIVRLRSTEIATVVRPTADPNAPIAYALLGKSGAALNVPSARNTAEEDFKIEDVLTLDKVGFPIQMSRLWGQDARVR